MSEEKAILEFANEELRKERDAYRAALVGFVEMLTDGSATPAKVMIALGQALTVLGVSSPDAIPADWRKP